MAICLKGLASSSQKTLLTLMVAFSISLGSSCTKSSSQQAVNYPAGWPPDIRVPSTCTAQKIEYTADANGEYTWTVEEDAFSIYMIGVFFPGGRAEFKDHFIQELVEEGNYKLAYEDESDTHANWRFENSELRTEVEIRLYPNYRNVADYQHKYFIKFIQDH